MVVAMLNNSTTSYYASEAKSLLLFAQLVCQEIRTSGQFCSIAHDLGHTAGAQADCKSARERYINREL